MYSDLHDNKGIVFPSSRVVQQKKVVTFANHDSDGTVSKATIEKIAPEKKKVIYSLKRKMVRVKEAAKICKLFL